MPISQVRSAVQLQESLPVSIRRLRVDDIDQVVTIEKEAFSPLWVSSSFKRDINNKRANYLVACFDEEVSPEEILAEIDSDRSAQDEEPRPPKLWSRMLGRLGFSSNDVADVVEDVFNIAGYVSVWYQGEDAHITEIAVKETLRGRGVGELLLIGSLKARSEEHTSELQSRRNLVCRLLLEKKKQKDIQPLGCRTHHQRDATSGW